MFDQFKALLELKARLFWRTFHGAKALVRAFQFILGAAMLVVGCGAGVVMFFLCSRGLPARPDGVLLLGGDVCVAVFLLMWLWGLLSELQRSDIVDFKKMLYLPVSLRMVFLLNYCASLVTAVALLFAPALLGAVTGLVIGIGYRMLLVIPIAVAFYLAVGAWSYYVQGLMAVLLENKRRRRAFIACVSLFFVILGQLPNLVNAGFHQSSSSGIVHAFSGLAGDSGVRTLETINRLVPFGWLPYAVNALAMKAPGEAALCLLGLLALAAAGLAVGLTSTYRYYTAAGTGCAKAPAVMTAAPDKPARNPVNITLPFIDEETSTLVVAGVLSLFRHPQLRIMMVMPFVMLLIFGAMFLQRPHGNLLASDGVLLGAVMLPFLSYAGLFFNLFGSDGNGFRVLVLLPTERRKYLLGKNLALLPFVGTTAALLVAGLFSVGSVSAKSFLVALLQIPVSFLAFCMLGNLLSLYFPYRMQWDGMRKSNVNGAAALTNLLVFPLTGAVAALSLGCLYADAYVLRKWAYQGVSASILLSLVCVGLLLWGYQLSLNRSGRLMLQREQILLEKLQHDRE